MILVLVGLPTQGEAQYTSVELATDKTVFYGKDLNHVRAWYFWLRRKLGKKKSIDTIKKTSSHERRITTLETDSLIVLGRLKGLRSRGHKQNRGKKFNRKLSGFPYCKFTEYLSYKACVSRYQSH